MTLETTPAAPSASPTSHAPFAVGRVPPGDLRVVSLFADLADDELAWIAERAELAALEPGGVVFRTGDPAEWMFVALEGTVQVRREQLGPSAPVFVVRPGEIGGTVPFSRMREFIGTARAVTRARVARFHKSRFEALLARVPVLAPRFVSLLIDRVRDATRREAQLEKLLALGKLSAGIAHEMNNPSAVVLRALGDGRHRIEQRGRLTAALVAAGVEADAVLRLDALIAGAARAARAGSANESDGVLARSDRVEAMGAWLARAGVADPWMVADTFVDAGLDEAALERALDATPPSVLPAALAWLESGLAAQALLASAEGAAGRVVRLVESIKRYTNRDRARDLEDVDVRDGLDSALALFAARVREQCVTLERDYAPTLPHVRAYPGDLNQVWSNLLDNALDALASGRRSGGHVTVRARADGDAVLVEICDDGPGIAPELQDRVWEPFFTTKEVGQGAGLGLDVARRIVGDLHGGTLTLRSAPGDTCFAVRLPLTTIGTYGA